MSSPDLWTRLRRLQTVTGAERQAAVHAVTQELTLFAREDSLARLAPLADRIVASQQRAEPAAIVDSIPDADLDTVAPAELPAFIALLQLALLERGVPPQFVAGDPWDRYWHRQAAHPVLLDDPAGLYARCDHATRAQYFRALRELAGQCGLDEVQVARSAAALARQGQAHIGDFLIGERRSDLETMLGCRVPPIEAMRRAGRAHPTAFYLGGVAALTAAGVAAAGTAGGVAAALLLIPILSLAVDVVNCAVAAAFFPPPRLPKLRFAEGIPSDCRTAVAMPVIIHGQDDVEALAAVAETNYLANAGDNLLFVLLTDFADAPTQSTPADAALLDALARRTRELNGRHGRPGHEPFVLLHRDRRWNDVANVWMGWERKRGKLAELNERILRGDHPFGGVRFVITLDADTLLPAGSAARLIGAMAHPLNRFTVLQPRMKARSSALANTLFDMWFPITPGLSVRAGVFWNCRYDIQEVYHALFGDCLYCGKGIYDVGAFHPSVCLPENAVLSHDHIEGMHGRAGLANDVILLETYSANLLTHMQTHHRWTRGDWQLLPWLLGTMPRRDCALRLSLSDRWRLFENLRWTLLPVSIFIAAAASWLFPVAQAPALTLAALSPYASQNVLLPLASFGRAARGMTSWRRAAREAREALARHLVRSVFVIAFLPYEVCATVDAIVRALARMAWNRRKLLEWKPMAQAGRAIDARMTPRFTWREMSSATAIVVLLAALVALNSRSITAAAPLLLMWLAAPQLAYWTAIPLRRGERP